MSDQLPVRKNLGQVHLFKHELPGIFKNLISLQSVGKKLNNDKNLGIKNLKCVNQFGILRQDFDFFPDFKAHCFIKVVGRNTKATY